MQTNMSTHRHLRKVAVFFVCLYLLDCISDSQTLYLLFLYISNRHGMGWKNVEKNILMKHCHLQLITNHNIIKPYIVICSTHQQTTSSKRCKGKPSDGAGRVAPAPLGSTGPCQLAGEEVVVVVATGSCVPFRPSTTL